MKLVAFPTVSHTHLIEVNTMSTMHIVAGRVRAQLFQPAQFLSKLAHYLCRLVGGLPDSSLCV